MNKEYNKNQKIQRASFKKYRKYIRKVILYGGIALASAFIIPYNSLFIALKGVLGQSMAMNVTFFAQWGIAALSAVGSFYNALKASLERKRIENAQDDEENIFDGLLNENDELKKKVEVLEKSKTKSIDEYANVKKISTKEKEINIPEIENNIEKEKKYVK